MFFYLSKAVWWLAQPSSLILLGLMIGIWLVWVRRVDTGLRWLFGSLAGLLIVGLSTLGDVLTVPLETRFARPTLDGRSIEAIIVLGGAEDSNGGERELMGLNEAAERVTEGAALANRLPGAKLVFSGGSASILTAHTQGAKEAKRLYLALGIPDGRIVLEERSRTTYENAVYSKELLQPAPGRTYLLVTSAWHMPRAVGTFRAQGFDVLPWPVDYRAPATVSVFKIPAAFHEGLRRVDFIAKEYAGLLGYRLTGRTNVLFPSP